MRQMGSYGNCECSWFGKQGCIVQLRSILEITFPLSIISDKDNLSPDPKSITFRTGLGSEGHANQ